MNYHSDSVNERSLADKSVETIVQFVAQNRGKFSEDNKLSTMTENYGLIELKDGHIQVKMLKDVFKHMLEETNIKMYKMSSMRYEIKDIFNLTVTEKRPNGVSRMLKENLGSIVFYHLKLDKELRTHFGLSSNTETFHITAI